MSKKMFPSGDSVDTLQSEQYTDNEIRRVGDLLEKILHLLEGSIAPNTTGSLNLDSGILSGTSPAGANEAMTVNEAAKLLRISRPKMYELVHDGKVHSVSVGRKILVSRSSWLGLLQEGEKNNG